MIRAIALLLSVLWLCGPAHAESPELDLELLAAVQTEAIEFMVPRALDTVTPAQLAVWGLGGLTVLDPSLTVIAREKRIALCSHGRVLAELPVPPPDAPMLDWGHLIAKLAGAGYAASPVLRQAGQNQITRSLFDDMLAHLDPYTRYVPPIEAVDDRDRRSGRAGIGLTLYQRGRLTMVGEVVIGSPGALAGLMPGDTIQSIDGRPVAGRPLAAIEAMLGGPEGTGLHLGWRGRDGTRAEAALRREMVPPETVFPRRAGDIAIVRISGFTQTTDLHVAQAIRDQTKGPRPVTGIVLDLRGNRGGVLRTAIGTANHFLARGVVVRASGRAAETNRVWLSGGGELLAAGVRVAVLVDGGTASAAEVLAAALADRGRAVVIGSATFGKGLVQTIDPLPDGGELFLTWGRLLAPKSWPIQSLGLLPQVCTSRGDDAVVRQMNFLAAGTLEPAGALAAHRAARAPLTPDRIVAIREWCPAADPRGGDMELARGVLENPGLYAAALLEPFTGER